MKYKTVPKQKGPHLLFYRHCETFFGIFFIASKDVSMFYIIGVLNSFGVWFLELWDFFGVSSIFSVFQVFKKFALPLFALSEAPTWADPGLLSFKAYE